MTKLPFIQSYTFIQKTVRIIFVHENPCIANYTNIKLCLSNRRNCVKSSDGTNSHYRYTLNQSACRLVKPLNRLSKIIYKSIL
jgi:hypothetical protein